MRMNLFSRFSFQLFIFSARTLNNATSHEAPSTRPKKKTASTEERVHFNASCRDRIIKNFAQHNKKARRFDGWAVDKIIKKSFNQFFCGFFSLPFSDVHLKMSKPSDSDGEFRFFCPFLASLRNHFRFSTL
jgi:hypothetical protein